MTSTRLRLVALAVLLAMALLTVGCTAASTPAPEQPAAGGTEQPAATAPTGSTDGQALLETKCTLCHSLQRVDEAKKDQAGWETTVSRMQQNGAVLTAEEKAAIIDYLTQRDGM